MQQTWLSNNLPNSLTQSDITINADTRRMSEPCHTLSDKKSPPPRPASVNLSPLKTSTDIHPNQAVVLDEVGEGEMVENKLVIPDEMVHYLNQVADTKNGDINSGSWSENRPPDNGAVEKQQVSSTNQMFGSPSSQLVPSPNCGLNKIHLSPTGNLNHMLHSPQNTNMLSPTVVTSVIPSPVNTNQILPSPASNVNETLSHPSTNVVQMMPSPSNNMMPSPAANFGQMLASPSSNYSHVQNPVASPASTINQMISSPSVKVDPSVQSPVPVRCPPQMMSPDTTNNIGQNNMMESPALPVRNAAQVAQNQQNCSMMAANHVAQNGQVIMPQNHCYHAVNHNMCYIQHTWSNNVQQNHMCQSPNQIQPKDHLMMCHSRSTNMDYNNQCQQQMQPDNAYINFSPIQTQCNYHSYQVCNNDAYVNTCHANKRISDYSCDNYAAVQIPSYGFIQNMNSPLTLPPNDSGKSQQARLSRPCSHYDQNCYHYNRQCTSDQNICGCVKMNLYKQTSNTKCYHHYAGNNEIQCKDISQSQMSPNVSSVNSNVPSKTSDVNGTSVQMHGMRQDAYQRTLEYVQNCQSWVSSSDVFNATANTVAKCADTTNSNMIVNDMTSSLSSLLEENRYLQMIQ